MGSRAAVPRVVVVAGDVTVDWNLARTRRSPGGVAWNPHDMVRAQRHPGGAMLLRNLIAALIAKLPDSAGSWTLAALPRSAASASRGTPVTDSFAIWSNVADGGQTPVWRVEEFLGLEPHLVAMPRHGGDRPEQDHRDAAVVVLDDANLGFRNDRSRWPAAITRRGAKPWVVVKIASPVAEGALWDHLIATHADRLLVVMTADDLRRTSVQISRELSWERTGQDLAWELSYHPRIAVLSRAAHVVVSFDTAGSFLLSRTAATPERRLFFDSVAIEGTWERGPGRMIGYTTCLVSGLVRQLMLAPRRPDLGAGVQRGVAAMRELFTRGYGVGTTEAGFRLRFPVESVCGVLSTPEQPMPLAEVTVPLPGGGEGLDRERRWSILEDRALENLGSLAEQVARNGPRRALQGTPIGKFNKLETADRGEIEGLRAIRATVQEYLRQAGDAPLCLAVFGPPGAGKSFGVKQVAKSVLSNVEELPFNLSQLGGPTDLHDAFHRIRDARLAGKVPLVFWDEFDSSLGGEPLGWLRHFLAPMQDGTFQQGQVTHPTGRAIFVFAGGTRATLESFARDQDTVAFRDAKGPDFVSRLKGHLNIIGPNPRFGAPEADPQYRVRRAILLRSLLRDKAPQLFAGEGLDAELRIDDGVLRGFLNTWQYRHGARAMESIIVASRLAGKTAFERSSLPTGEQLQIHVDALDFLSWVNQLPLDPATLEKLAIAVHESFCRQMREIGYRPGKATSEGKRTHSSLKPFARLTDHEKNQNRENAADIPGKLASVGLVMVPRREPGSPFEMPPDAVEILAEREHDRWVRAKIVAGWRHANRTDKERRRHQDLLPWGPTSLTDQRFSPAELAAMGPGELSKKAKEKDRNLVRDIPRILAAVGYTVARTERGV